MPATYHDGPPSDHFDGRRFFNRHGPTQDQGLADILRWKLARNAAAWPEESMPPADHPPARVDGLRIAMVGHASLLVQIAGRNILVDPVWARRAGPLGVFGPRRHGAPGIGFDDLPAIDHVLVTHDHYDHLDIATLRRLWRRDRPRILAPLGNDRVIMRAASGIVARTADWWDEIDLGDGLSVVVVPANHWSLRTGTDRRCALWGGFMLRSQAGDVYLAGDTAYGDGSLFDAIRHRLGAPLVAALPIGAYAPRWFMRNEHMDPEEAVDAFTQLQAGHAVGIHWDVFALTDEPRGEPAQRLAEVLAERRIAPARFPALRPGEIWQPAD